MWYIYILQSEKDNKYYIGYTSDLMQRLKRHNSGGNVSTRNRRPFKVIYSETYDNKRDAMRRERRIKSYKGGNEFKKIIRERLSRAGGRAVNCTRL